MRHSGVLRTWHPDRGFGFIAPTQGGRELFVHVSSFQGRSDALCEGERLSYELGTDKDGKPQALKVQREALVSGRHQGRALKASSKRSARPLAWVVALAVVLGLSVFGYGRWAPGHRASSVPLEAALTDPTPPQPSVPVTAPSPPPTSDSQRSPAPAPSIRSSPTPTPAPARASPSFRCDGRLHCSQMTSCEEAHYFLAHCPGVKMDGNNDGVPCEQQWCGR